MSARAVGAPVPTERPGPDGSALIRFRHVFKIYRVADTGVVALGGVDFDIAEGEFVAIVGPSGSGKSTILNMIGGLDRATAGIVEVEGRDLGRLEEDELTDYRRERVGFVWQGTARNLVPYLNVVENVKLPTTASGSRVPAARRTPGELLEVVGLPHRGKHRPGSSRAASSSASRSRWRSRTSRRSCSPTSRPPSSIASRPPSCSRRSGASTTSSA